MKNSDNEEDLKKKRYSIPANLLFNEAHLDYRQPLSTLPARSRAPRWISQKISLHPPTQRKLLSSPPPAPPLISMSGWRKASPPVCCIPVPLDLYFSTFFHLFFFCSCLPQQASRIPSNLPPESRPLESPLCPKNQLLTIMSSGSSEKGRKKKRPKINPKKKNSASGGVYNHIY